ncbi:MAG: hypothetical protein E7650_02800 [Ruminococcaceae bacterium]|nr:hypothetical protein [Oscillospiraceae bacterium]MBQ2758059.1 hypothetical protein [Clostridia bacterium]
MIEQDSVKLLRECDAGVKMGISSIKDVLGYVRSAKMKEALQRCREAHEALEKEIEEELNKFSDEGKEPSPIAKSMSWLKTTVKLSFNESDHTIADLMTDGCNMGVKSLSRYLNQYKAAEEFAKDIAKKLIHLEADLAVELRGFL